MRTITAVLTLLVTLGSAASARAADPTDPNAAQERSTQLYLKAHALQEHAKWAEAEATYQAAWDLRKTFDIAGNLGDCELHVGQNREAAEHLSYALKNFPAGGTAAQKEALTSRLQQARAQIGTVRVSVNVAGAAISVDGRAVEAPAGDVVFVEPGSRTVEAKAEGYVSARQVVVVGKGAQQEVKLTLTAVPSPVPPPPPPSGSAVPPPPVVPEATGPRKEIIIGGGAVAGAALIAGVVFTVVSNGKAGDAAMKYKSVVKTGGTAACAVHTPPTGCADLGGLLKDRAAFADAALWSFVVAGAVGAGTLIYAIAAPHAAAKAGVRAAPIVTGEGGGVVLSGAW